MKIKLTPVNYHEPLIASISGEILTLNDVAIDLSQLRDGDVLPAQAIDSPWFYGDIQRVDGEIHLTLVLPHGANAPHETRFPAAYNTPMTVMDGVISLPPYESSEDAQV